MKNLLILFILFHGLNPKIQAQTVTIGTQVWMTKNLDVSTFRNGDPIPEAKTRDQWDKASSEGKAAWCYFEYKKKNGKKYGKLYNWYAVNDSRGLAPIGYHVPSEEEWKILESYLGEKPGKKMKFIKGWNNNGNGNNESGFSGLPGGYIGSKGSYTPTLGEDASWWSSSEYNTFFAYYRKCSFNSDNLFHLDNYGLSKLEGLSVRCVKD
jgi:uncharacterized protein (TIGR02145 family)